jgi:hypothetical protein
MFQGALPITPPVIITDVMRKKMGPNQPHPHVFSWAYQNGVNTDSQKVMRTVLFSENLRPRTSRLWVYLCMRMHNVIFNK